MTRIVMTCLWKGEDLPGYSNDVYRPEHVANLAAGVRRHIPDSRLVVLADDHYAPLIDPLPVDVIGFSGWGCGGWSNVLEAFRPGLRPPDGDRVLLVGLDTVIVGDCEWLFEWRDAPIGLPLDPYHHPEVCDAVVTFDAEGADLVWSAFLESRKDEMRGDLFMGKPSEMALLRRLRARYGWDTLEPEPRGRLMSYKVHVLPDFAFDGASIVYFHGEPKPDELDTRNPIRREWERGE